MPPETIKHTCERGTNSWALAILLSRLITNLLRA